MYKIENSLVACAITIVSPLCGLGQVVRGEHLASLWVLLLTGSDSRRPHHDNVKNLRIIYVNALLVIQNATTWKKLPNSSMELAWYVCSYGICAMFLGFYNRKLSCKKKHKNALPTYNVIIFWQNLCSRNGRRSLFGYRVQKWRQESRAD